MSRRFAAVLSLIVGIFTSTDSIAVSITFGFTATVFEVVSTTDELTIELNDQIQGTYTFDAAAPQRLTERILGASYDAFISAEISLPSHLAELTFPAGAIVSMMVVRGHVGRDWYGVGVTSDVENRAFVDGAFAQAIGLTIDLQATAGLIDSLELFIDPPDILLFDVKRELKMRVTPVIGEPSLMFRSTLTSLVRIPEPSVLTIWTTGALGLALMVRRTHSKR